ncbi:MAG: hypothetical protein IT372_24520 [Polyangiaceae bacterium]|nr:hypothetical protein [Polyangiaceae bacterium]
MAKQVTDRQGAVNIVASAAETHADRFRAKFAEIFTPYLKKGEKLPDVGLVALLVARRMRALNETLVTKSDDHDAELADDVEPRERRDAAAAALTAELVEIRATLGGAFEPKLLREIGLEGKTEVEPKAVLAQAKRLVRELKSPRRKWPKPKRKGVQVNPGAWVEDLEREIDALEKAQIDVARELREGQAASDAKAQAMSANDDAFGRGAGWLSKLFSLLMDDTLAAKVRPAARRPGRVLEEEAPAEEAPAEEEPAEEEPAEEEPAEEEPAKDVGGGGSSGRSGR